MIKVFESTRTERLIRHLTAFHHIVVLWAIEISSGIMNASETIQLGTRGYGEQLLESEKT